MAFSHVFINISRSDISHFVLWAFSYSPFAVLSLVTVDGEVSVLASGDSAFRFHFIHFFSSDWFCAHWWNHFYSHSFKGDVKISNWPVNVWWTLWLQQMITHAVSWTQLPLMFWNHLLTRFSSIHSFFFFFYWCERQFCHIFELQLLSINLLKYECFWHPTSDSDLPAFGHYTSTDLIVTISTKWNLPKPVLFYKPRLCIN